VNISALNKPLKKHRVGLSGDRHRGAQRRVVAGGESAERAQGLLKCEEMLRINELHFFRNSRKTFAHRLGAGGENGIDGPMNEPGKEQRFRTDGGAAGALVELISEQPVGVIEMYGYAFSDVATGHGAVYSIVPARLIAKAPMQQTKKAVRVVAGLIWRDAQILVQQRPAGKANGLLWEFPGGKVDPGENDVHALIRECREEIGVDVHVGPLAWEVEHLYEDLDIRVSLTLYHARLSTANAKPQPHEAAQLRWMDCEALPELPFCPADKDLVEALAAGSVRPPDR
jgi:8-oxo-dGTP diphosphatase